MLWLFALAYGLAAVGCKSTKRAPPSRTLVVEVHYPGAAAAEMDALIARRLEESLRQVEGLGEISAVSVGGRTTLTAPVKQADHHQVQQRVHAALARLRTLPVGADRPRVYLRRRTHTQPASARVRTAPRLRVEVHVAKLRAYGLTIPDVIRALRETLEDPSSGRLTTRRGAVLLRTTPNQKTVSQQIRQTSIATPVGDPVRVKDVATVRLERRTGSAPGDSNPLSKQASKPGITLWVELSHRDYSVLSKAATRLLLTLDRKLEGGRVPARKSTQRPQLHIGLTAAGQRLGVTQAQLAEQLRLHTGVIEIARWQRRREELSVVVLSSTRAQGNGLTGILLKTAGGQHVSLAQVARVTREQVPTELHRRAGKRVTRVAVVSDGHTSVLPLALRINRTLPELRRSFPGLRARFR